LPGVLSGRHVCADRCGDSISLQLALRHLLVDQSRKKLICVLLLSPQ
jgi:hypothetical protein